MKAIVTKSASHDNIIMISTKNPENASIMLVTIANSMNDQGFLVSEKRVGLVKGTTEGLKALNLKEGDDYSAKICPVKLVVKESFDPFYPGQEAKINPKTKEVVTSAGAPVYRQTIVVALDSPETDAKLATDKIEAVVPTEAAKRTTEFSK